MIVASASKAASRPSIEISVRLNVLHSHCVYAIPTEVTKAICVMYANAVPNL